MRRKPRVPRLLATLLDKHHPRVPLPRTIADLQDLSLLSKNCACSTCAPPARHLPFWPHHKIPPLTPAPSTPHHGPSISLPPVLSSPFTLSSRPTHLVNTILYILALAPTSFSPAQLSALSALHSWRDSHWHLLTQPIPSPDGRTLLPPSTMLHLAHALSTLLFTTPIPRLSFRWSPTTKPSVLAHTHTLLGVTRITMNPLHTSPAFADYAVLDFFSTLVHEVLHAFLHHYACAMCMRGRGEGAHGNVFQTLARRVGEVVGWLVGVPVRLGRFESFLGDLGVGKGRGEGRLRGRVPCGRELERWGFEEREVGVGNREVAEEVERVYRERWRG